MARDSPNHCSSLSLCQAWQRRTNVWRIATNPARGWKRHRSVRPRMRHDAAYDCGEHETGGAYGPGQRRPCRGARHSDPHDGPNGRASRRRLFWRRSIQSPFGMLSAKLSLKRTSVSSRPCPAWCGPPSARWIRCGEPTLTSRRRLPGGSIDPLGFERGYLALADKILPGLTNAAGRPRYFPVGCAGSFLAPPGDRQRKKQYPPGPRAVLGAA
jgi:hypothetical protein